MRELDDVEIGREGGVVVEQLKLGGWCVGGDGEEADLEAEVDDQPFG